MEICRGNRKRQHVTGHSARVISVESVEQRTLLSAWPVVDDFQLANGQLSGVQALALDSAGNLYAAGSAWDTSGHDHGIVREKPAGQSNWITIEDFTTPSPALHGGAAFHAIAVDNSGDVYVSGEAADPAGQTAQWIVLKRAVGSNAFNPVDTFTATVGSYSAGLAVDSANNVFAVGSGTGWVVRKQSNASGPFITIDTQGANAYGVTSIPSGPGAGLYAYGTDANNNWQIRKSTDAGASWTTVDTFKYDPTVNSNVATALTSDAAGNLYAVGRGNDANSDHWIVRCSTDGGASWSTVDDYRLSDAVGSSAFAAGTDAAGDVFVVGRSSDSFGTRHSIIRTNAGGVWATVSDLPNAGGFSGFARDPSGILFTAIRAFDSNGISHWTIQSSQPDQPRATLTAFPATLTGLTTVPLTGIVGSFADSNPAAKSSDFTATIHWSDGHSSPGFITFNPVTSRFDVSASHTYTVPGTYSIGVMVAAPGNVAAAIDSTASIIARGPQPHLTGPTLVYEASQFSLQLSSTDTDNFPIANWHIDWGDGSSDSLPGTAPSVSHSFPDGYALKHITATATDSAGFSNSTTLTLQVQDVPPTGDLTATAPASLGQNGSVQFSKVTDPSPTDTASGFLYSYDFNNDGVFEIINTVSPSATVSTAYLSIPGVHLVRGRVADKDGLFTDHTATIVVPAAGPAPVAVHNDLSATAGPLSAALYCATSGARDGGDGSMWIAPGDYLAFCMDFGASGIAKARMLLRAANVGPNLRIQMRLDDISGVPLATFSSKALSRGGQSVRARNVTGAHELYIVVTGGQANISSFSFTPIQPRHTRRHNLPR